MTGAIGQRELLAAALRAVRRGRVAHAQLIVGPAGAGKGTLAERIAGAHLCLDPAPDGVACGACAACTQVAAGAHPDLHWVGPEGRLGIDEARALGHDAVLAPHSAPCAVFVVEACERLTGPAAAALLKTLEEPAGAALFLLLAEHPDQVEPTLRSRCLQVRMRPVPLDELARWLAEVRPEAPEPLRQGAARGGHGWPGRALRLLDDPPEQAADLLCAGLAASTPIQVVQAAMGLAGTDTSPEEGIAVLRDAWLASQGLDQALTPASRVPSAQLGPLARLVPTDFGEVASAAIAACAAVDANVNASLNWQVLFHRLRRARSAC